MIAQFFPNDEDVFVLDARGDWFLAKLPMHEVTHKGADAALRRMGLRRREKWQEESYGWQAKVRWIER